MTVLNPNYNLPAPICTRGRFDGLKTIARFNWPMYAAAFGSIIIGIALTFADVFPSGVEHVLLGLIGVASFWTAASLIASHWIYDRSLLLKWIWLRDRFANPPIRWINLHAGHDESTPALHRIFGADGEVFDFYDAAEMSEPSITRARNFASDPDGGGAMHADFRALPVASGTFDAAFTLLTAHELRTHETRLVFFREILRTLRPGGRLIVAEQLRDAANWIAFGPGCLHFHSRSSWVRVAKEAGFLIDETFRITPFVIVFNLRRHVL